MNWYILSIFQIAWFNVNATTVPSALRSVYPVTTWDVKAARGRGHTWRIMSVFTLSSHMDLQPGKLLLRFNQWRHLQPYKAEHTVNVITNKSMYYSLWDSQLSCDRLRPPCTSRLQLMPLIAFPRVPLFLLDKKHTQERPPFSGVCRNKTNGHVSPCEDHPTPNRKGRDSRSGRK